MRIQMGKLTKVQTIRKRENENAIARQEHESKLKARLGKKSLLDNKENVDSAMMKERR